MKEFKCDLCGKNVKEDELFGDNYEVCFLFEKFIPSFEFGEIVYNGEYGELCSDCVKKKFKEELSKVKK